MSLKLTLKLKSEPVEIDGKSFTLNELTGAQRDTYLGTSAAKMNVNAEGKVTGIKSYDGLQTNLVALVLRDEEGKPVPEATLKTWPATTVEALFGAAQTLNGLGVDAAKAEEAAKKA